MIDFVEIPEENFKTAKCIYFHTHIHVYIFSNIFLFKTVIFPYINRDRLII